MTVYCNFHHCDECRERVKITVVQKWMDDDGQWRHSKNHLYCLAHVAAPVAELFGKNISFSYVKAGNNGTNRGALEDDPGSGIAVEGKADAPLQQVGMDSQEAERELETEDAVGETFRGENAKTR